MVAPLSGHTFAVDPASWDQQLREVEEQWICLRAVKFYQTGKGEEEVIHAGNEDLQFELVWIQSHRGLKMCHLQSSFSQLQTRCECPGKQRFRV